MKCKHCDKPKSKFIDIRTNKPVCVVNRYNYGYLKTSHFTRKNLGGVYE